MQRIVIGTRASRLALAQTALVSEALVRSSGASLAVEVRRIATRGDVLVDHPLTGLTERGVFVADIESALRRGEVDVAVHSAKDLPSTLDGDLDLAAFLPREDPRDVLVSRAGILAALAPGARVGTSSPRRALQVLALRPDVEVSPLRGNVDTRLRKLDEGQYDAIVLAAAGLIRLGLADRVTEWFDVERMVPAPGQGAIVVQTRAADERVSALVGRLDHAPTRAAVMAERAVLARLGVGCAAAAAAYATVVGSHLRMTGILGGSEAGAGHVRRATREGAVHEGNVIGVALADALASGAGATAR